MSRSQPFRTYGLPLLAKELIEQAARKRTYVVRVVYAVLLFFAAYLCFYSTFQAAALSPFGALGRGRQLYVALVFLQYAGIYFFMPAMTCGAITQEKQAGSLQLLFLTKLGPWTILFEKLLSRLAAMLVFLFLSLPLLAFAYSLGGISTELLWTGVAMLVLATIQMGTLALACSAFFRTTVGAFIASYAFAFLMFFGPWIVWMALYLVGTLCGIDVDKAIGQTVANSPALLMIGGFPFFGPASFLLITELPGFGTGWSTLAGHAAIILTVSGIFLVLARVFLVSRASLTASTFRLGSLGFARRQRRLNSAAHSPGASVAAIAPIALPDLEPVAWRELKRSWGRMRPMLVVEGPLLIFCGLLATSDSRWAVGFVVALLQLMLWAMAVLVVAVQSSSLIAGERSQQTLDVLCTTPISGREIVLQKFRGVRQLILVLLVPFVTLFLFEARWHDLSFNQYGYRPFTTPLYLTCSALSVGVYLPMIAWLSLAIGLKVRSQVRAMIGTVGAIAAWCVLPIVFIAIPLTISLRGDDKIFMTSSLLSPASIVFMNEANALREFDEPWLAMLLNFGVYGAMLVFFRRLCLTHADRWLGRSEQRETYID